MNPPGPYDPNDPNNPNNPPQPPQSPGSNPPWAQQPSSSEPPPSSTPPWAQQAPPPPPYGGQQSPYPGQQPQQPWPPNPGQPGFQPGYGGYTEQVNGTLILVLGILSFVCCGIVLGPIAFILGNNAVTAIDAGRADPSQRGIANAGRICGLIGGILSLIWIIYRGGTVLTMLQHHP